MKRLVATIIVFTLAMGNFTLSLALPNENKENQSVLNQKMITQNYNDNQYVESRFSAAEYILVKVGEKLVEYSLDYVMHTGYAKIVTRNGVRYCVVYNGNPMGAQSGSYRIYD